MAAEILLCHHHKLNYLLKYVRKQLFSIVKIIHNNYCFELYFGSNKYSIGDTLKIKNKKNLQIPNFWMVVYGEYGFCIGIFDHKALYESLFLLRDWAFLCIVSVWMWRTLLSTVYSHISSLQGLKVHMNNKGLHPLFSSVVSLRI